MSLSIPRVPCNDTNMLEWQEYKKERDDLDTNKVFQRAMATCIKQNYITCVANNQCENTTGSEINGVVMGNEDCTKCIYSGAVCGQYLSEMSQLPCQMKPAMRDGKITPDGLDQMMNRCCGESTLPDSILNEIANVMNGDRKIGNKTKLWEIILMVVGCIAFLVIIVTAITK